MNRIRLFVIILNSIAICAHAQSIIYTGNVKDARNNAPISFVAIVNKENNKGAIADKNGHFSILTYAGASLTFSSIGYKNTILRIPIDIANDSLVQDVYLYQDTLTLKDVIIRGYPNRAQFATVFVNKNISKDFIQKAEEIVREALGNSPAITVMNPNKQGVTIISVSPTEVITRIINYRREHKYRGAAYEEFWSQMPDSIRLNNPHLSHEQILELLQKERTERALKSRYKDIVPSDTLIN